MKAKGLFKKIAAPVAASGFMLAVMIANVQAGQLPGPLVNVSWLKAHKGEVILLDVRKHGENFVKKGHIPGAVLVPWKDVRAKKTVDGVEYIKMLPSAASFGRLMKKSGVSNDSEIVITTSGANSPDLFLGTRLYWQLKYYGHDNVAMLDGGNAAWVKAKMKTNKDASAAKPGSWKATAERKELLATTADVEKLVNSGSKNFVDARTLDYHLGLEQKKKYVYNNGHIPGSKLIPHNIVVSHKGPKTFRSIANLKATFTAMGVDLSAPNVAYCNSGHLGSGVWFILHELAGDKSAKLYDGSMHAWTKAKNHRVTKMQLN